MAARKRFQGLLTATELNNKAGHSPHMASGRHDRQGIMANGQDSPAAVAEYNRWGHVAWALGSGHLVHHACTGLVHVVDLQQAVSWRWRSAAVLCHLCARSQRG